MYAQRAARLQIEMIPVGACVGDVHCALSLTLEVDRGSCFWPSSCRLTRRAVACICRQGTGVVDYTLANALFTRGLRGRDFLVAALTRPCV